MEFLEEFQTKFQIIFHNSEHASMMYRKIIKAINVGRIKKAYSLKNCTRLRTTELLALCIVFNCAPIFVEGEWKHIDFPSHCDCWLVAGWCKRCRRASDEKKNFEQGIHRQSKPYQPTYLCPRNIIFSTRTR